MCKMISYICVHGSLLKMIKTNIKYIYIGQQTEVWFGSGLPQTCIQPRMHPRWRHWGLGEHMRLSADLILQAHYWNDAVWHLKESLALQKTHQHYKRERGMHSTHEHRCKPAITAYRIHTHTHGPLCWNSANGSDQNRQQLLMRVIY